jgi:hypothetical protein
MARQIVNDELWEIVEPVIPKVERRYRYPGRKRIPDRQVLTGILFVLPAGSPGRSCPRRWAAARGSPAGAGSPSGSSRASGGGFTRCCSRSSTPPPRSTGSGPRSTPPTCGPLGGEGTGPSPVDRRKPGSKHHVLTCGRGNPLAVETSAANVNDVTRFVPLLDAVRPVRGRRGRPRRRPKEVYGDRAYLRSGRAATSPSATTRRWRGGASRRCTAPAAQFHAGPSGGQKAAGAGRGRLVGFEGLLAHAEPRRALQASPPRGGENTAPASSCCFLTA